MANQEASCHRGSPDLTGPVSGKHTGEKVKASEAKKDECIVVTDDEIREE